MYKWLYWTDKKKTVRQYINSCMACLQSKPDIKRIKKVPLQIVANRPLEVLSVDIVLRLPRSEGFGYIISMVYVVCHAIFVAKEPRQKSYEEYKRIIDIMDTLVKYLKTMVLNLHPCNAEIL